MVPKNHSECDTWKLFSSGPNPDETAMSRNSPLRRFRRSSFGRSVVTHMAVLGVRALVSTLRMTWVDRTPLERLYTDRIPFIFAYWHQDLVLATRLGGEETRRQPIVVMTSPSRDGQVVGEIMGRQGLTVIHGSSKRGGYEAFFGLVKHMRTGMNASIAVDGPRGPHREVKEGVIRLAQMTGHVILPCAIGYERRVEFRSWDRLRVPFPFSRAAAACSQPISIPRDLDREEVPQTAAELKRILMETRKQLPYNQD